MLLDFDLMTTAGNIEFTILKWLSYQMTHNIDLVTSAVTAMFWLIHFTAFYKRIIHMKRMKWPAQVSNHFLANKTWKKKIAIFFPMHKTLGDSYRINHPKCCDDNKKKEINTSNMFINICLNRITENTAFLCKKKYHWKIVYILFCSFNWKCVMVLVEFNAPSKQVFKLASDKNLNYLYLNWRNLKRFRLLNATISYLLPDSMQTLFFLREM